MEGGPTEVTTGRGSMVGVGDGLHRCASCELSTRPSSSRVSKSTAGAFVEPAKNGKIIRKALTDTLDLRLLRSPSFILFSLACTLHMTGKLPKI